MQKIAYKTQAPDFELTDTQGRMVRMQDFRGRVILLVMLRGFAWPHCRKHLVQLRQDQEQFTHRHVEVLVIGPDNQKAFQRYWEEHKIPFIGMADRCSKVASRYHQEINIFKLGRMPALFIVDAMGLVRFHYYSDNMADIIPNQQVLEAIDRILVESEST